MKSECFRWQDLYTHEQFWEHFSPAMPDDCAGVSWNGESAGYGNPAEGLAPSRLLSALLVLRSGAVRGFIAEQWGRVQDESPVMPGRVAQERHWAKSRSLRDGGRPRNGKKWCKRTESGILPV